MQSRWRRFAWPHPLLGSALLGSSLFSGLFSNPALPLCLARRLGFRLGSLVPTGPPNASLQRDHNKSKSCMCKPGGSTVGNTARSSRQRLQRAGS